MKSASQEFEAYMEIYLFVRERTLVLRDLSTPEVINNVGIDVLSRTSDDFIEQELYAKMFQTFHHSMANPKRLFLHQDSINNSENMFLDDKQKDKLLGSILPVNPGLNAVFVCFHFS